jgi:hypothetical protein
LLLAEWQNFYVIVGSAAAALTGLMFVVIALIAEYRGTAQTVDAFGTPTVVHFSAVVLQSAILSAPWPSVGATRIALGAAGAAGVIYMLIVLRRALRQKDYKPVFEDWLFHCGLPLAAYAIVASAAAAMPRQPTVMLFFAGGAAVLLLFVGIHNAWDTVTYVVVSRWAERQNKQP